MTKVYCCNFMEQIYQWFEYRRKLVSLFCLSCKTVVKDDWLEEQEPEAELSVKHLKLSIARYFKACCNLFWYGLKPALLISHTSVDHLI